MGGMLKLTRFELCKKLTLYYVFGMLKKTFKKMVFTKKLFFNQIVFTRFSLRMLKKTEAITRFPVRMQKLTKSRECCKKITFFPVFLTMLFFLVICLFRFLMWRKLHEYGPLGEFRCILVVLSVIFDQHQHLASFFFWNLVYKIPF